MFRIYTKPICVEFMHYIKHVLMWATFNKEYHSADNIQFIYVLSRQQSSTPMMRYRSRSKWNISPQMFQNTPANNIL